MKPSQAVITGIIGVGISMFSFKIINWYNTNCEYSLKLTNWLLIDRIWDFETKKNIVQQELTRILATMENTGFRLDLEKVMNNGVVEAIATVTKNPSEEELLDCVKIAYEKLLKQKTIDTITTTTNFKIENYGQTITYIIGGAVVVVILVVAYSKYSAIVG